MDLYPMREAVLRIKETTCLIVGFLDSPVRDTRRNGEPAGRIVLPDAEAQRSGCATIGKPPA